MRFQMIRVLVALVVVVAAVGCASESPTAVVQADGGDYPVTAYVYDHAFLTTSVVPLPSDARGFADGLSVAPDGMSMDVRWTQGVRHLLPPVVIAEDRTGYIVDINIDGGGDIFVLRSVNRPGTSVWNSPVFVPTRHPGPGPTSRSRDLRLTASRPFGPMQGDQIRVADADLFLTVEENRQAIGDEPTLG